MKNQIIVCLILLSALLECPTISCQETIQIGASPYPISTFQEKGEIIGLDFDLVEAILKEAGIHSTQRILKPWKRILIDLNNENVDMVVPMVFTKEREKIYNLTPSIRPRYNIVLVNKGFHRPVKNIFDLEGLIVGKCDGYAYQREFLEAAESNLFETSYCLDNQMGLKKLRAGRSHALMIGEDAAYYLIKTLGLKDEFKITEYRAQKASHVGIHKSNTGLYKKFLTGFEKAKKKGSLERIIQKWKTDYAIQ